MEFLRRYPPFADLPAERLAKVARAVEIAHFPAGEVILRQDGPPADALHIVRKGAVELLDDGVLLDLLAEGEVFGQFSLLARGSPSTTVRAHEDTLCYLVPEPFAGEILGSSAGLSFVIGSLRQRLRAAAGQAREGSGDPRYRSVGSLVRREPITATPTTSVADAARLMTDERVSCLLVPMREGWGIVTDRDLRARVVAERAGLDGPVETIASFPALTIDAAALAGDALTEMLASEVHHLPVVEHGKVVGVVTDTDLMGLGRHTPFALKSAIRRARSAQEVAAAVRELPELVASLVEAGTDAVDVGRVTSLVLDAATEGLVAHAVAELGDPPAPFAWLALGSTARREPTLSTDQDHALAFEPPDGSAPEELDAYFGALATAVTDGLEAAGIPRCHGDAMAVHPPMRRPLAEWEARFRQWMASPSAEGSVLSSIGFDFRRQAGGLDAEPALDAAVREARALPEFQRMLGRRALSLRPPTGFFGDLVVESRGAHEGRLDVKRGGITIVTNLARAWGIVAGSSAKGTLERLEGAAAAGALDEAIAEELGEAFRFLWDVRVRHQVARVREGRTPDDFVDPSALDAFTRSGLKEAFRVIERGQRLLASELGVDLR